jgi:hypothetical protein
MSLTTNGANTQLAWTLTTDSVTRPTAWYVALHTANPTETGTVGEVSTVDVSGYSRATVTFDTPASSQIVNDGIVTFTTGTVSGTVTVTHLSIWNVATAGTSANVFYYGALSTPKILSSSETLTFASGELTITQD